MEIKNAVVPFNYKYFNLFRFIYFQQMYVKQQMQLCRM